MLMKMERKGYEKSKIETEQWPISLQPKEFKDYGVIVDGGSKVYMKGFTHYEVDKITDEQFEDIANDYDDIEAPPGPYKVQPENQGAFDISYKVYKYENMRRNFSKYNIQQEKYCGFLVHLEWASQPLPKF